MFRSKFETSKNKSVFINRRMFVLSAAKVLVFGGIVIKLFDLQILKNKQYKTLSDKNRIREWKLAPRRGVIKDFFNKIIADNAYVYQLHLLPENIVDINHLFFRLKKLIQLNDIQISNIKKKIKKQKPWEPIIISHNLTWENFSKLNLFLHELSGIELVISVSRKYTQNEAFAHIVGYVGQVSKQDITTSEIIKNVNVAGLKVGKTGLEKALNHELIGSSGYQRYEVNAYGKRIKKIKISEGEKGNDFRTTLDTEVQKFISGLLLEKSASVCVMNIYTGEIIAMVSSPTFDPNYFVHGITSKQWKSLLADSKKPLMNKCISGLYPPGSTIKPIVALSALEFNIINPKFSVICKGMTELHGQKYHCWKKKGHGQMRLRNAIKQSCDIYFYEIARLLGIDKLSITAKKYGLGKLTLPGFIEEKIGIVPDTRWKLKFLGRGWVLGETLISGIGQGYFQTTPLQLCLMTAQLANGGYKIKPKIIDNKISNHETIKEEIKIVQERSQREQTQGIISSDSYDPSFFNILFRNQENIKFVLDAMYGATNEVFGTSYQSRHTKEKYLYAGKTGTSQIKKITEEQREKEIKTKDIPYESRDHALFTAFAPYKDPKYAISIVIEHGGSGSSAAAPLAKKIIKKVIDRDEERIIQKKINYTNI